MRPLLEKGYDDEKMLKDQDFVLEAAEINRRNQINNVEGLNAEPLISIMKKEIVAGFGLNRYVEMYSIL